VRRRWTGEIATEHLPEPSVDGGIDDTLLSASVRAATKHLPPKQRACVVLRYFLDLSEADTASAMGTSTGAVKSNTARALDALRGDPTIVGLLEVRTATADESGHVARVAPTERNEGIL